MERVVGLSQVYMDRSVYYSYLHDIQTSDRDRQCLYAKAPLHQPPIAIRQQTPVLFEQTDHAYISDTQIALFMGLTGHCPAVGTQQF